MAIVEQLKNFFSTEPTVSTKGLHNISSPYDYTNLHITKIPQIGSLTFSDW